MLNRLSVHRSLSRLLPPSLSPSSFTFRRSFGQSTYGGLIGSIDQGTSSSRFILFDSDGRSIASHQKEVRQHHSHDAAKAGWSEHDPLEILHSVEQCIAETVKKASIVRQQVKGIGITNQRESCLVWDKRTGRPFHNSLVWHDTRTEGIRQRLIEQFGHKDYFRSRTGLPISNYFSALKLLWFMENVPTIREAIESGNALFGTMDTWLLWNLTGGIKGGVHVTDVTNASRTMMMNLKSADWDETILDELKIPRSILPTIKSSAEVYANVANGPLVNAPISGCVGDQQGAMLGQMCFHAGQAKNTYGTGCFMLLNTGTEIIPSTHGLLTTACYQLGPKQPVTYALEGSISVAGSAITWARDSLQLIDDSKKINEIASTVPDSGGMYFVPAFSGLLSPYWRPDARGVFVGLTHGTTRAHFLRSILEASAYQTRDVMAAMIKDSGLPLASMKVDGGMSASDLLMQFQADILQCEVIRPQNVEATARGAAFAAGLAVDFWPSTAAITEIGSRMTAPTIFKPKMSLEESEELYRHWKRAVERTLNWVETDKQKQGNSKFKF